MEHFVTFDNVCKYYQMGENRIAAADHVTFHIEKGEFCIIVGPSGAGKTTVLNMLGGMDTCDEGHIWLDGKEVSAYNQRQLTEYRRYDVGFVFQFYNLVQNLTALENVELASEICKEPLPAAETLRQVGLEHRMGNFPAQLSGGEQQRVSIARALAIEPSVLICDEATSSLDVTVQKQIMELLAELRSKEKMACLFICHNLALVQSFCDRVLVMYEGRIVEEGTPDEVIRTPRSAYTRQLVEAVFEVPQMEEAEEMKKEPVQSR